MKLLPPAKEVKKFLIIFYIVGVAGFAIPQTKGIFIRLIPLALLMNFGLLLYFHRPQKLRNYFIMLLIAVLGFSIEIIGIHTGVIFGNYAYGAALGPKLLGTPYIIGINWLILTYCIAIILDSKIKSKILTALSGASIITIFDIIMEPVAIYTGMWNWGNQPIPVQNYIAWFILSFVFVLIFKVFSHTNSNKLAGAIFFLQLFFFAGIFIAVKLILP